MAGLLIFGALVALMYLFSLHDAQAWRAVGAVLGLGHSKGFMGKNTLHGSLRGFGVVVTNASEGQGNQKLVAQVHGVDPGFTLARDSALLRMVKPDIETGDQVFDERTRIEGDADRALAVLGDEARRLTEIVITGSNGVVEHETIRVSFRDIRQAGSILEPMLDLAKHLRRTQDSEIPVLLAERALHDSSQGVRLQAFRQLSSSLPHSERALSTAEQLLDTPSASLRLEACHVLLQAGPERSVPAAEMLVELAARRHVDSSIRRSALEALTGSRHRQLAIPAILEILRRADEELPVIRRAALEGLFRAGANKELLEIQPVGTADAEVLARGLGGLDTSAQPRLVQLLEHPDDRVRVAAASSLARVGDLDAIAVLRRVAGTGTLFKSAVAREAEHAIREIKSRSGGSQRGEISMVAVAPLEGAVSQADGAEAGGEVSLTP
ncbi:MAG: HEAT repeat domain-containing protein [Holophagales bacterium]|nr:HEAT repeat domain-containing protein [Holophagales bacterium]